MGLYFGRLLRGGLVGSPQASHRDAQEGRQLDDRGAADRLAHPGGEQGPAGHVGGLGDGFQAQVGPVQQVVNGLASGHGGRDSGIAQKNPAAPLDFPMPLAHTCPTDKAPPVAFLADHDERGRPEPVKDPAMEATNTAAAPYAQLPNLPPCPRCSGHEFEPDDLFLCEPCFAQLAAIAAEEAAEDRAREAFEDREFWGSR